MKVSEANNETDKLRAFLTLIPLKHRKPCDVMINGRSVVKPYYLWGMPPREGLGDIIEELCVKNVPVHISDEIGLRKSVWNLEGLCMLENGQSWGLVRPNSRGKIVRTFNFTIDNTGVYEATHGCLCTLPIRDNKDPVESMIVKVYRGDLGPYMEEGSQLYGRMLLRRKQRGW